MSRPTPPDEAIDDHIQPCVLPECLLNDASPMREAAYNHIVPCKLPHDTHVLADEFETRLPIAYVQVKIDESSSM